MEVRPHLHLLQINSLTMPYLFAILYDLKTKAHKISHELLQPAVHNLFEQLINRL